MENGGYLEEKFNIIRLLNKQLSDNVVNRQGYKLS